MRRRKKGHARGRKGRSLKRRRYGRSAMPKGAIRMNVSGQLVLDPEKLEEVVEKAVEMAVEEAVPEAVEETVPEAVAESFEDLEGRDYYGG